MTTQVINGIGATVHIKTSKGRKPVKVSVLTSNGMKNLNLRTDTDIKYAA